MSNSSATPAPAVSIPWSGVIAVEGRTSADLREIKTNALTWGDEPLPVTCNGVVIGRVDHIEREGELIRARGALTAEAAHRGLGVFVDQMETTGSFMLRVGAARIRSVMVIPNPVWPDCVLDEAA